VTSEPHGLSASAIVRSRDKADTIEQTFAALLAQTVPVEIVVVDSGSTDGTLDIARRYADVIVEIAPEEFSYGGALNIGSGAAHGDVHFPLSAHSVPMTTTWVADALMHYGDDRVAATNGLVEGPDGRPLDAPYRPSLSDALANPAWGFSNHAGSWRASVVREHPFREDLSACEDKEWFWRVLEAGYAVTFDPALYVPSAHRRNAGVRALYQRSYKEARALAELGHPPVTGLHDTMRNWSNDFSYASKWPSVVRFFSPHRVAEQVGTYAGSRAGSRAGSLRPLSVHSGV
jgi:rhamnosyltransferase